jgi:hypothetical protein
VRSADGFVTTFTLNGDTKFRRPGNRPATRADVKVGAKVGAHGPKTGETVTARRVVVAG